MTSNLGGSKLLMRPEDPCANRELEYGTPRLHSPVNSRRFPETFGNFGKNKTSSSCAPECYNYEEGTRLAETRLAQNAVRYI